MTIEFHYFTDRESNMHSFYRLPKELFTNEYFEVLSCEAKVLYGMMLDRISLSRKNKWIDDIGRVYIIFTVEEIMENCYFNSMKLAMDNGIRSIAFPSISTGVYSFPIELAAKIAVHTVNRFLQDNLDCFDLVEWVLFDAHTEEVYKATILYQNI